MIQVTKGINEFLDIWELGVIVCFFIIRKIKIYQIHVNYTHLLIRGLRFWRCWVLLL